MEKSFSDQPEPVTGELRSYIVDWGKSLMKKNYQITRTRFLEKYGGIFLYDIDFEKIYYIDDEEIHFIKGYVYALIGNPYNPYGTSTHHEYFIIHDDLFDIILETDQNPYIALKVIHKDVSLPSINDNGTYSSSKLRNRSEFFSTHHQLQRKRQKKFMIIH